MTNTKHSIECYDYNWEKLITISDSIVLWRDVIYPRGKFGRLKIIREDEKWNKVV